jgi:hypothetical protein
VLGLITIRYSIRASSIADAGKGFFLEENVRAGRVLMAPTNVTHTVSLAEIMSPQSHPEASTSVVWFEDQCVTSPDLPDDYFINHSFEPNGLWHLGFVFALRDLDAGEELCLDYRHLIAPGYTLEFCDGATGREITGYDWRTNLGITTRQLLRLVDRL